MHANKNLEFVFSRKKRDLWSYWALVELVDLTLESPRKKKELGHRALYVSRRRKQNSKWPSLIVTISKSGTKVTVTRGYYIM